MIAALLGTLLPIAYLACGAVVGGLAYAASLRRMRDRGSGLLSRHEKAAWFGVLCGVLWPAAWTVLLASFVVRIIGDDSSDLSRKQRRRLEFERQSAQVAADAAKAQREWQQLLAEEQQA